MRTEKTVDEEYRAAREAVVEVLLDYATAMDTRDWARLAACFTTDCTATYRDTVLHGPQAVVEFMRPGHDGLDGSVHRLSNIRATVDLGANTARSTSYVDALLVNRRHPDGPTYRSVGVYRDVLRREGGWRIAERSFEQLWIEGKREMLVPCE
jgi:3-phenylpropionate/cinnamic acid dioxygenase small subunit